jgi:hypothetical protein
MSKEQEQEKELSAKELAERVGADPKELRKWLRSEGMAAGGTGRRYAFAPDEATKLARKFKATQKAAADAS